MEYCNTHSSFTCGCDSNMGLYQQINANTIYFKSASTNCIPIIEGQTLDVILKNIDTAICDITSNPSGNIYIVRGTTGQIVSNTSIIGDTTTYTLSLDSNITNFISSTNSSIADLNTCCNTSVKSIVTNDTNTLDISNDGNGNYTLNVTAPSGLVIYDGIINNDLTPSHTTGSGSTQILKTYTRDYITSNNISRGDEIRFEIIGQIVANSGVADVVSIELYDTGTNTVLASIVTGGFSTSNDSTYKATGTIDVTNINTGAGLLTSQMFISSAGLTVYNTTATNLMGALIPFTGNSSTYSNLAFRVVYNNLSSSADSGNGVFKLMVEVRKKI